MRCRDCQRYDSFTYYGSKEKKFRYCTITNKDMEYEEEECTRFRHRWMR